MSIEENKALARRWNEEIWSKGNLAAVGELLATNFVFNYPAPGLAPDREGYKQTVTMASFANIQSVIEDMVAEEDRVAVRWTWRGTHKGEYMGVAPTGKQVTITGISILRIVGGKIVEEWGEMDNLGMLQQLGAKLGQRN
jgi:steroid delta-isomerase-like uncharacterized protein